MKGIIFNLLEQVVSAAHGERAWDELLDAAGLDGVYTSLGSYPDEELEALVAAAPAALGVPSDEFLRSGARAALGVIAGVYPAFFTPHRSTKPFLRTLNEIIHPEVRKLYPGAYTPSFTYREPSPDVLVMGYHSKRDLCMFAEGLILGAADHYAEPVTVTQPECRLRGDESCVLLCEFAAA